MILALLLAERASAQDAVGPEAALAITASAGPAAHHTPPWLGLALSGGVVSGRWGLDLDARGGPAPGAGASALARLRLRRELARPGLLRVGPVAGAGLQLSQPDRPVLSLGASAALGDRPVRPRFELEYLWQPGGSPWQLLATVGFAARRPAPPPAAGTAAAPAPLGLEDAMVWVPEPVCAWLEPPTADSALDWMGQSAPRGALSAMDERTVRDPGADPFAARPPEPPTGTLVVAAWPGDRARVDEREIALDEHGIAVLSQPEGEVRVVVVGGGRRTELELAIALDNTLWVDLPEPGAEEIRFDAGSSALSSDASRRIAAFAASGGAWQFEVSGSYSAEGAVDDNARLAMARAGVVREALIAAGLSADRVVLASPSGPDPDRPATEQRVAVIRPVEVP